MVLAHDIESVCRTDDIKNSQNVTFEYMLLSERTLNGLKNAGFYKPSPIQLHGIPLGKCGFDLLLEAKSGTGKTVVFSVIALEKIVINNGLQVLILAPTREIAAQISDVLREIGCKFKGLVVECVIGGLPLKDDIDKFKNKKVHILVASPGRLRHMIQNNQINVSTIRLLVLDEADKLVDSSFLPDVNYIFSVLPTYKQVIMSSATYPEASKEIINKYMRNPQHVCPDSSNVLKGVQQKVTLVKFNSNIVNQTKIRYKELINIFTNKQFKQCLIFCNYQARVSEVHKLLTKDNWPAEQLYGSQEQTQRLDAIKTLKEFKCRILIATDLAARGIDASSVDLVISFEPAWEWTTYLHRIGRAGRYGSYGEAITIISEGKEEADFIKNIGKVMTDSWNIYHLWSNKKFNSGSDCDNDIKGAADANNDINEAVDDNNDISKGCDDLLNYIEKDIHPKILKEILDVSNSESISRIEDFDELLNSFQNNQIDNLDTSYKNIEINNVKDIVGLLSNNNNSLNNENSNKIDNINEKNETKLEHINNNVEEAASDDERMLGKENDLNVDNNLRVKNINTNLNKILHNNCDAMAELGLPTSFSMKEDRIRNKQNFYPASQQRYNNYESKSKKNSNYNKTSKSMFLNESHNIENTPKNEKPYCDSVNKKHADNICDYYKSNTIHKSNFSQKKESNQSKSYKKWYNDLKCMTRQIEHMIYIREMSK